MDKIIELHRDPLFSIIIIVAIIVLVALADWTRNRFKANSKQRSLDALAKNFEFVGLNDDLSALIDVSSYSVSTLTFIANIYVTNGNFQEAIKIYLTILDKTKNLAEKIHIFELLGTTYLKAGFLQRAKNIFIEILKNNPRNVNVLRLLMQTHEILGEYKDAYDVITCLEELDSHNIALNEAKIYMKILVLINDSIMSLQEREREILRLNKQSKFSHKFVLNYFKTYNNDLFWGLLIESVDVRNYIDLLWNIDNPPLERILEHKQIADVYRAKGIIDDGVECDIFELENMRLLHKYSHKSGNLGFKYRCKSCQCLHPFEQHRCQSCGEPGNISLVMEVMEVDFGKSYSLL